MDFRKNKYLRKIYNSQIAGKFFALRRKIEFPIWSTLNRIKYGTAVFLDTNMIVSNEARPDKRIEKLHKHFTQYFVTDIVAKEVFDLSANGLNRIFPYKYETVGFSKMREILPSLCPVYYNFISWMYNPANIAVPDF